MNRNLKNAILFQIAWWSLLVLQADQNNLAVLGLGLFFAGLQIFLKSEQRWSSVLRWMAITFIGFLMDLGVQSLGWIQFPSTPWWLLLVWFQFAGTLNQSLSYFRKNIFLSFVAGFVFGPISYLAASKWQVFTYPWVVENILGHALLWGIAFILFLRIANDRIFDSLPQCQR